MLEITTKKVDLIPMEKSFHKRHEKTPLRVAPCSARLDKQNVEVACNLFHGVVTSKLQYIYALYWNQILIKYRKKTFQDICIKIDHSHL